ncbi:uncharacterized protein PHA67_011289 isoform 1-T1 [Liasis olivaceus]
MGRLSLQRQPELFSLSPGCEEETSFPEEEGGPRLWAGSVPLVERQRERQGAAATRLAGVLAKAEGASFLERNIPHSVLHFFWNRDGNQGPADCMPPPQHLFCSSQSLLNYEAELTVWTEHGETDWYQIGKGVRQDCIFSPYLFNQHAECMLRLEEDEHGLKLEEETSITCAMLMTLP